MALKFVEHAETKNASKFKEVFETVMAEKVSAVMEECKIEVAGRMFNEDGGLSGGVPHVDLMPPPSANTELPGKEEPKDEDDDSNDEDDDEDKGRAVTEGKDGKWLQNAVHPSKKGMFKGVGVESIKSRLAKLRKSGPHKKGSAKQVKQAELDFALRAKEGHGFRS